MWIVINYGGPYIYIKGGFTFNQASFLLGPLAIWGGGRNLKRAERETMEVSSRFFQNQKIGDFSTSFNLVSVSLFEPMVALRYIYLAGSLAAVLEYLCLRRAKPLYIYKIK